MDEENLSTSSGRAKKLLGKIEAFLFQYGEPVEIKKIAKLIGVKESECKEAIDELEEALKDDSRGLTLLRDLNRVQLVTKPDFKEIGEALVKEEFRETLTPASLETLSIVAYLGPLPRTTIDYIRGVNSSFTLRSLLVRGLIERNQEPHKGNVYYYRPSFDFLKHMGLGKIEEMPEYERYKDILKKFEIQSN